MSTTTLQELDAIFNSINKYKEFKRLELASKDERELIKEYIELNAKGYKETLERVSSGMYNTPESFKKEMEEYQRRNEEIINNNFKDVYYFIDKDKIVPGPGDKPRKTDIVYAMTLDEM